jgi:hypothetical protein
MILERGIHNFMVWPLEQIHSEHYMTDDLVDTKRFRTYSCLREQWWIRKLRSMRPWGLNLVAAARAQTAHRAPRPGRQRIFLTGRRHDAYHNIISRTETIISKDSGPDKRVRVILAEHLRFIHSVRVELSEEQISIELK